MKKAPIDLEVDLSNIIDKLGQAAFSATGNDAAAPIWELFFPEGDPEFSVLQTEQMTAIFTAVLAQHDALDRLSKFTSATQQLGLYAKNPNPLNLPNILSELSDLESALLTSNVYQGIRLYTATAALYLLALNYDWENATGDNKPNAAHNIGAHAYDALNGILALQTQMASTSFDTISAFQDYALFGNTPPESISDWLGPNYRDNVAFLIQTVNTYAPDLAQNISPPQLVPLSAAFDPASMAWNYFSASGGGAFAVYQMPSVLRNGLKYFSLGCVGANGSSDPSNPDYSTPNNAPFLANYAGNNPDTPTLISNSSLQAHQMCPLDNCAVWYSPDQMINGVNYTQPAPYATSGAAPADIFVMNASLITPGAISNPVWSVYYGSGDDGYAIYEDPTFYPDYQTLQINPQFVAHTGFSPSLFAGHPISSQKIYRFLNSRLATYVLTCDPEFSHADYHLEKCVFETPMHKEADAKVVPLYAWYNPNSRTFFYCVNPAGESAAASGFIPAGIVSHVSTVATSHRVPLHRWVRSGPAITDYFYTTDPNGEGAAASGYSYEHIEAYVASPS